MNEIDKAELIQGLKAFLIPSSLFVACLLGAAGTFLIREGYQLGWGVIAASAAIIVSAFAAFITFQNKLRKDGKMVDPEDLPAPDYDKYPDGIPHDGVNVRTSDLKTSEEISEQKSERQEAVR